MRTNPDTLYQETLSSRRTIGLFIALAAIFLAFLTWRWSAGGLDGWGIAFLCLAGVFTFYTLNYRALTIQITGQHLRLKFGLFTRTIPHEDIATIQPDHPPPLKRYGGAGIHWYLTGDRYRASWNLLEYERVVVQFKHPVGPVQELSFSTKNPEEVSRVVRSHLKE
jgi:hypothetical protein